LLSDGDIQNCSNYADIICDPDAKISSTAEFTGGIAGESLGRISYSTNNGAICGGKYVGGIVGQKQMFFLNHMFYCGNGGEIYGFGSPDIDEMHRQSYIGGIVGNIKGNGFERPIRGFTNIGHISGHNY